MTENPPISKDVKEFKFKLKCRLKVFTHLKVENPLNLLAAASKYGVVFAGTPNGVQCIRTESILSLGSDHGHSKNITAYPKRTLELGVQPSHLSVSADNELLAIALIPPSDCAVLFIYSIASFGGAEVIKKCEVRLSNTPGVTVTDLQWNPGMANVLAVVMADGSAAVIEFKDNSFVIVGSIPQNSQASCLCWSPKGKQVVIGAKNGSLTQYKPELKAVKTFPPPQLQGTMGLSVVSVHWLSNFQFIAAYRPFSDPSARAYLMVVNVPKNSPTTFVNYEDFCFGSNTSRPEHYFIHQPAWNMLIVGTTNSMDANVLGMEGEQWVQWMLDDGGRAELPLTNDHQDVYNIGMCFDISPTQPVPIGENISVDPMPLLVMLSHDGVLCYFQAINLLQGAAKLCQPPQQFPDSSGLHLFSLPEAGDALAPNQAKEEQKVPDAKELGQELDQAAQPNPPISVSTPQSLGKPVIGQATLSQSPVTQPFNMNFSFGQQSLGQSLNFNQPSLAPAASQPSASPIPKFSLASQATQGQATMGLSLGGLGFTQSDGHNSPQSTFGSAGGFTQSMWPSESNQKTALITSKQSIPIGQSLSADQTQQSNNPLTQPSSNSQQSSSVPLITQAHPNFQQQQTASVESTSNINQIPAVSNSSQSTLNQVQSNEATNKSPQFPSQDKKNSQPSSVSSVQPSSIQPEPSKPSPVSEIVEESDEKKLMKEMEVCQALLQNFSVEMEQKQAIIKFISSQTDCNISESKLKDQIIQDVEKLRKFEEELKATGVPDQSDVIALGNSILEIFGWYEKIKAKERMAKNPGYIELMESQDLDPITKNYLNNIDRYVYYVESQIKQAKAKLSSMWDNIGSPNFEVPVMEVIYQSLVAQMNVLAAKKAVVDSCEAKMKKISKNRSIRNSRRCIGDLELSTLAERLLDTRISDTDLPQDKSIRDASINYIMLSKKMAKKNLNEEKVNALHQWHKNHKVITTKVSKKNAFVVNGDISKDETFYRVISPNKQSTPYLHATPKKAISSIPRKSLFTLTSNMSNGHLETSQANIAVVQDTEENQIIENKIPLGSQVLSEALKTSESNHYSYSLDSHLKNNLATAITKGVDVNKINGIQISANISVESTSPSSSTQPNTLSSVPSTVTKEPIPTPAFFKGVPTEAQSRVKENNISTSWGAQTPVFSQTYVSPSNISTSVKTTLTSSKSIFSGSLSSGGLTSSSFSFNLGESQPPSSAKSLFPQSNPAVSNPLFFSAVQKSSFISSQPGEKESSESVVSTASATYIPSNIKSTSSSTSYVGATTTVNSSVSSSPSSTVSSVNPVTTSAFQMNLPLSVSSANQFGVVNNSLTITPIPANSTLGAKFTLGAPISTTTATGATSVSPVVSVQSKSKSTISHSGNLFSIPVSSPESQNDSNTGSSNVVTEVDVSQKSSVPTWTGVSSLISSGTSTTSSSTTSASVFGGTSVFGSLKTPVVSSQSTFSGSPVFASSAPTSRVFSSTSATANANIFGTATATATTTSTLGSNSTTSSTTSPVSSVTSQSIVSTAESAPTSSFGSLPTTLSSVSVFGTSSINVPAPATSVFGQTTSTSLVFPSTTTTSPLLAAGTTNTTAVTSASVFSATPATTSTSVFGSTPKTTASVLGTATTTSASFFGNTSVFGAATTSVSSVFGGSNITTASSVFGVSNTTTASSIFGGTTTTTTASSVFGGTVTTSSSFFGAVNTTSSSLFGTTTTTPSVFGTVGTTASSLFGTTSTSTASSIFGASNTTTASSLFGTPSTTSTPSVFGTASTTSTSSVFGTPSTTSTSSVFGTPTTTSTTSVFGTPTTTSTSSVFGTPNTTSSSIFGSSNATTSSSVFGTANTTSSSGFGSQSNQGIFGAAAALSSTSFFGSPTTTSSSFGNQSAASIFGGSSSFGTPSTTNSFFGKPICSPTSTTANVFGSATNVFGTATTTSASSIFGGNSFQQKSSPFGQTTGSVFGQTTSSGGNFGTSGGSLFGSTPSFGSPSTQGNIFQSSGTGNIFGAAANTSPFSGASQTSSQPTFGSPPSFQSAQRPFGTAAPVFGGQSTFGSSPTFGGSPTFGSPGSQTFGSPTQHSSTFENLANQETLSFGNLAQQQTFPTTSFGGSSFSSWRS